MARRARVIEVVPRCWTSAGRTSRSCPPPPRRKQKERDLERDPAASGRARTSQPRPPRDEGRRPRAGSPRSRPPGRGRGSGAGAHVEAESTAARAPAASWQWDPASTLEAAAFGRGVAVWRGGAAGAGSGGQRTNGCPRQQLSGPCQWRAEPGLPPKRDWARAEAKGRSGAQQGASCSSPGRRQSGPWRQGEGWGQEPSGPAPEAASSPAHLG